MSVKIRLQRFGAHKKPFYRVVAITSKNKRDGKFLEILGTYEPFKNLINLDVEKIDKWRSVGGEPTKTVQNLLKKYKNNNKQA
ncbi:30S ribosomal protein S16 [Candidatus Phytoplasma pruni]|jgi:small subunit ribosomal protein S16|uniref:Small ribosomal subunit protein bS16 n=1 Tax=Candidatus Phytoplasma pruni TaxID=479893 RepID=A0A851HJ79_9MOLU|nr:30S ribosomal protein S16 [Candidatus Phytoplasma pruni]NWN45499.1 30S ribosomal protein S16 [Candidatus Phytoplasma pruni]